MPKTKASNGQVDMNAVAEQLQDEATVGYRAQMPLEALWLGGTDLPHITLRRDLEFMQTHPVVMMALDYYKSGIAGAEFWGGPDHNDKDNEDGKPISPDARVAEFVLAHAERFWQRGMPLLQEGGYPHGWAAGEHIYKENKGMMVWSHLKDFHPNDVSILTEGHNPVGTRVKNIRGRNPVDLWFASGSIPAKACWYPHRPRFGQFYGRSQLLAAWRPWRRLGWRDGWEQVIDGAVYRFAYCGPIVRHPLEDMGTARQGIPATQADGVGVARRNARDVARQIVEWCKTGSGITLSSAKYSPEQGGGYKWEVDWPKHVLDPKPLIEGARYLEDQIFFGVGVPPELARAGGTGSGYSGRSIPREAFLDGQQKVADAMLQLFVEQVVKPLVLMNFGDVPFEVSCKSLLQSQAEDKQGEDQGQPGQPGGMQPPRPAEPQPAPPPAQQPQPAFSQEVVAAKVKEIIRRVLRRAA